MTPDEIREQMIAARDEYINLVKRELFGPGSEFPVPDAEHELISSSPTSRYSVGILYPQGNQVSQDNDETVPLTGHHEDDADEAIQYESNVGGQDPPSEIKTDRFAENDETADENLDEEVSLSSQYMPSSMGITFLVEGNTDVVIGKVSFATYRSAKISECVIPFFPDNPDDYSVPLQLSHKIVYDKDNQVLRLINSIKVKDVSSVKHDIPDNLVNVAYRFADFCRNGYVREPHEVGFELDFSGEDYIDSNRELDGTFAKITALRTKVREGLWSVTIMFVNGLTEIPVKDHHCIFQPKVEISSVDNSFVFVETSLYADQSSLDEEECSLELLYRNKKIYGTGLGVAVDWEIDESGNGSLWSEYFPQVEVPQMSFDLPQNNKVSTAQLSMKYLSDLDASDKSQKLSALKGLVGLYEAWVNNLEAVAKTLDPRYKSAATANIAECRKAYSRMYEGIWTLETNQQAYSAFLLANRAMFMQRIHLGMQEKTSGKERYPGDEEISSLLCDMDYYQYDDRNAMWRPFQIAFLLMDINSIVKDDSPDRNLVDLIWFPTGGGKTEAYLGLTAFTIFYRRLVYQSDSEGTAVIMRYTLRLLAAQQFTRAATLICACECIRSDKSKKYPVYLLGKESITIGLWIGGTHIPNKNKGSKNSAKAHLDELIGASATNIRYALERHNKFQVLKCPWCGTKMTKSVVDKRLVGKWGYALKNNKHFYLHCTHEDCPFEARLPIQIIDEELYESPPTLLFGTVDKFAMIPWNGNVGAFFAAGRNSRAPELIIQDELHLISGALGTIVGLYETAIDALCSQKGVKAKIIASTATIRRAKEQCSVLYDRDVVQFPAPGLNAEDSFFARERKISLENGVFGRRYVGIMPSGKTKAMTEIRALAGLLQTVYTMKLPDAVKDKLWTLTVYFNSLKDLGKASTLVDDDVKDFIVRMANRMFRSRRLIVQADELTSRVTTTGLNETLDKLEKLEYSAQNMENHRFASSVLLATNMISVGIDVARLNVMLMVGQPKLTSEYIQASSRVGRSYPGTVFVQYDATKSRDRSHYERFMPYHESFYRFVEPTGATPFSKPARDRALHAVLTSIMRHRDQVAFVNDKDAIQFDEEYYAADVRAIKEFVINRISNISNRTGNGLRDDILEIESEIDEFFYTWQRIASDSQIKKVPFGFGYKFIVAPFSGTEQRLLKQFNSSGKDNSFETLTSMRNVDNPVRGKVVIWEDKE
ncbi:helicase-related protein [uncultured Paenibacillus sp.]|uniref:helicase-related protein n=1 Tax=uncultured Paenibacillus sp. TaxID=227322 RepID=UPI0015B1C7F9|nr:helicase-related protein [uncultured Paenibacillus sp.]